MRKKISLFVLCLMLLFGTSTSIAGPNVVDEKALKMQNSIAIPAQNYLQDAVLEKIELDKSYEQKIAAEDQIDKQVGTLLVKYTKNNKMSEKATSIEKKSRIEAMNAIVGVLANSKNLDTNDKGLLLYYLSKYAPYSENQFLIQKSSDIAKSNQDNSAVISASSYSGVSAVNYAYSYVDKYNTGSYPDLSLLGGDCTNFVSQAMKAGGKSMQDGWYLYKKNSKYSKPATTTQLNYSWNLKAPSPWISANEFGNYWSSKLSNETFAASYILNNQNTIFGKPYYRGDTILILKKRYWWYEGYHLMLVTSYASKDYLMTYHSNNKKDKALREVVNMYNTSDYNFRFFSVK